MVASKRATADILESVQETLKTAEYGLEDLIRGSPERKLTGPRNLIAFGRAVTNVLQKLRSKEPGFDEWYAKYREEMESDPLMRYFYKLRTVILKEGRLERSTHVHIRQLCVAQDLARFGPPPPGTISFFIGDNIGGTGFEVRLPDGSIEKYYVELPSDIGTVTLHFPDAPKHHLGQEIEDTSVERLSTMYIDYLREMVKSAKREFGSRRGL